MSLNAVALRLMIVGRDQLAAELAIMEAAQPPPDTIPDIAERRTSLASLDLAIADYETVQIRH